MTTVAPAQPADMPTLGYYAAIDSAADRLACYDRLAGRTSAPAQSPAEPPVQPSLLSKYWELEPAEKRGIFNFVGYRPNYVLPLHLTSRINREPQSPTQAIVSPSAGTQMDASSPSDTVRICLPFRVEAMTSSSGTMKPWPALVATRSLRPGSWANSSRKSCVSSNSTIKRTGSP